MASFLIVRFSSLGDVVLTTPLLRALRTRYPDAEVTIATKSSYGPLFRGNPSVTRTIALSPEESLLEYSARLRDFDYDVCMDLHENLRSRALRLLVPGTWQGYSQRRLARKVLITTGIDVYGKVTPVPERYFEASRGLGIKPDRRPPEIFLSLEEQRTIDEKYGSEPFVVLAPGARHATKRWPAANWRALAEEMNSLQIRVVWSGSSKEEKLAGSAPGERAFGYRIRETAALLKKARLVVANDSGPMHLATAVGTTVVAMFGPVVRQFGFMPYTENAVVVERNLSCRPCSAYGGPKCPLGHHRCLRDISVSEILGHVREQLA